MLCTLSSREGALLLLASLVLALAVREAWRSRIVWRLALAATGVIAFSCLVFILAR